MHKTEKRAKESRVNLMYSYLCDRTLAIFVMAAGWLGGRIPAGFLPDEDQGFLYANLSLPNTSSLERTDAAAKKVEDILMHTPGVEKVTSISGFSLLSTVYSTYNGFFF